MGIYKDKYPDGISPTFWDNFIVPMIKQFRDNKCEDCGSKDNLVIHHKKYDGEITIDNLKLLCRKCHYKAHHNKDTNKEEEE